MEDLPTSASAATVWARYCSSCDASELASWCNHSYSNIYRTNICPWGNSLELATMNTATPGNVHSTSVSFSPPTNSWGWPFVALILPIFCFYLLRTTSDGKLYDLGGVPILTAWTFFSKRYDFIRRNFKRSGGLPFRFRVLQVRNFLE